MIRSLDNLPPAELPSPCTIETVTSGSEMDFVRVIAGSLVEGADEAWFEETLRSDPHYDPGNLFIIREGETPVAVIAARQTTWQGEEVGHLGELGVLPEHRRKGLARAAIIFGFHRLRELGFDRIIFSTDDFRIPGLTLYVSLGFEPVVFNWVHRLRWKRILSRIR